MCDEFSMLIATFIVFYRLLSFSQTRFSPNFLLYSLLTLMATVMVAQFTTGESTVQQIVFTGMVYWLWNTCFKLISKLERDDDLKSKMRWMAVSGIGKLPNTQTQHLYLLTVDTEAFFISGHACWVTDFYACESLRGLRKKVGMPWASLLELHG